MIHRVPTNLVPDLWPAIEAHLAGAMEFHPFLNANDVRVILLHGGAQLFVVVGEGRRVQGFAVMEVIHYPRRRVANILASGGDDGFTSVAVRELLPQLKQWAAEQNADALAILGARPGWLKLLQNEGGNAEKFVLWWTELGDVQGRRQFRQPEADGGQSAVGSGTAVSH